MRLPGLDGIRAISITLVLLFHASASVNPQRALQFGGFGVNIFFILSGFLITWILCREEAQHGCISLSAFYTRRALRILPPAAAYLLVIVALRWAGKLTIPTYDLLRCLFFVRNLLVGGNPSTMHFWSLSVEEQFYLLWPLTLVLIRSNRTRLNISIALLIVSPFWHYLSDRLAGGAQYVNHIRFDQIYDPILIGCCLALARNEPKLLAYLRSAPLQSRWFPFAAVAAMALLLYRGNLDRCAYLVTALFINYAVDHEGGVLNYKPVMWLGKISYSLYLWQQLFCWDSPLPWLGRFPQNVIASLIAATLSYYFIELPFANLRKRVRFAPNPRWLIRPAPLPRAIGADG
jgi:peptidoglycan/LPS O-acetylase OafA/YrhL